jgi:hypothetical protein
MSYPAVQPNSRVTSAISDQRDAARKELSALNAGWQEHILRVVEGRFTELASRIQEEFQAEVADRVAAARRGSIDEVHRAVRRFEQCESQQQWAAALLDSVSGFCLCAALWTVSARSLRPLRAAGVAEGAPFAGLEIPLAGAPALAAAVESRDTVVTLATPAELSSAIAVLFDAASCAILPVVVRERAAAVLVAVGEQMDVNGLEAMASLAGAALGRLARTAPPPPAEESVPRPVLSEEEQGLHCRAQRFARVRVAEIRLYRSEAVRRGRAGKRLYMELRDEIDSARAAYEREFLPAPPSLPDYLHLELVRTLANEDHAALGDDYPGPLV